MANIYKIKKYCISNGEGIRTAVFFSGCEHKCKGCFNTELWDYNVGDKFTKEKIEEILSTVNDHIAGLSILGGDPLANEDNILATLQLCKEFKKNFPNKTIWLWTGWTLDYVKRGVTAQILDYIDVLVDGPFIQDEYDYNLKWRGSRNQRILYKGIDF